MTIKRKLAAGPASVLKLADVELPVPGRGEVLVQVRVASPEGRS